MTPILEARGLASGYGAGLVLRAIGESPVSAHALGYPVRLIRLAAVVVGGARTLMPPAVEKLGVEVAYSLEDALRGADVVMMLRIQLERQGKMSFPSAKEYFRLFGLTRERLKLAQDDAIVMHPGPMNRGVEIASDVADGSRSVILEQVTHGVSVRMAVLYLLSGVTASEES